MCLDCNVCDTNGESALPWPIGSIIRLARKDPRDSISAEVGATAIVIGYTSMTRGFGSNRGQVVPLVRVIWASDSAKGQMNGGYEVQMFDLVKEDFTKWRPDIVLEDRGIGSSTYGTSRALENLEAAVRSVRALDGHEVECVVTTEKVVTKTEKEVINL